MATHEESISARVWSSPEPLRLRDALCLDIGPRVPGTAGMLAGQECLAEALHRAGAGRIRREEVSLPSWREGRAEFEVVAPRRLRFRAIQHVNSAAASLTAPLFRLPSATRDEIDKAAPRIRGSIVLLPGQEISGVKFTPLPLTLEWLADRGAAAVVTRAVHVEGCPEIELVAVERTLSVPALSVSPGDGRQLEDLLAAGPADARIETCGAPVAARCANLTAELGTGDEVVVLGAHCDTFHLNPGALDNLTGVLTLVETVRALAPLEREFRRTLRVIVYTGEEYGLLGSRAYVAAHRPELDRFRFVLNMDTLWPATAQGIAVMWSPAMRDYIDRTLAATTRRVDVRNLFCMSSDYLSFMLEGIPAARPADYFNSMPPWSHTTLDTGDKIDPDWMRVNAMVYAQVLARILADPGPLPVRRLEPHQVRESLENSGAVDEVRSLGYALTPV